MHADHLPSLFALSTYTTTRIPHHPRLTPACALFTPLHLACTTPNLDAPSLFAFTLSRYISLPSDHSTPTASQPFVDETGAPATLPEMGNGGDESKLKVLLGLLRKYV